MYHKNVYLVEKYLYILMNKKILTSTIVIAIFVTITSMTIPLVSAQQNDTQKLQDIFKAKATDVQPLIGPTIEVLNVICPADPGPQGENCQLFEGEQIAGPAGSPGQLMAQGDTLLTGVCPPEFTDPQTQCQLFDGQRVN